MNLGYRKAFAKHYCPVCGNALVRVRPPLLESVFHEALWFIPLLFLAVVIGGIFLSWGVLAGSAALVAGFLLAGLVLYPVVEQYSVFRCTVCGRDMKFSETVSRGWSFV